MEVYQKTLSGLRPERANSRWMWVTNSRTRTTRTPDLLKRPFHFHNADESTVEGLYQSAQREEKERNYESALQQVSIRWWSANRSHVAALDAPGRALLPPGSSTTEGARLRPQSAGHRHVRCGRQLHLRHHRRPAGRLSGRQRNAGMGGPLDEVSLRGLRRSGRHLPYRNAIWAWRRSICNSPSLTMPTTSEATSFWPRLSACTSSLIRRARL